MNPKHILRILFAFQLVSCLSLLFLSDFYINEITKKYQTENSLIVNHLYFLLVTLSFSIITFTLVSSFLNNKGARLMLLATGISAFIILVALILFFFTTPFRPPVFFIFFLICIAIISVIYFRKTKYDFID